MARVPSWLWVLVLGALFSACTRPQAVPAPITPAATAIPPPPEIVQAGRLRVAVFPSAANLALTVKDAATGDLRGLAPELGRELAAKMGVAFAPVEYPTFRDIQSTVNDNAWDVTSQAIDVAQAAGADTSHPYLLIDETLLVRADSPIRSVADADKPGIRIGVSRGTPADLRLSRDFKQAELVRLEANRPELVALGELDAIGSGRQNLTVFAERVPGLRVLDDHFAVGEHVLAVPKGQPALLAYINMFIEEGKTSGLIQKAIDRSGVKGVQVAPQAQATEAGSTY